MTVMPGSIEHGPATRYHVYRGHRAHIGDFTREVDRHLGFPYFTLCGQNVDATFVNLAWTPKDCAACVRASAIEGGGHA